MTESLEARISKLETQIEIERKLTDAALVRTYILETALAHLANGLSLDMNEIERIMLEELGSKGQRAKRVTTAVAELRMRLADPKAVQPD